MAADKEKELKLVISAYTKGVEAGMSKVQADLKKLKTSTNSWGRDLTIASNALDVRPMKLVTSEVTKLRAEYARLKNSGKLSQSELAQAAANLKTKTAAARGQQSQLNKAMAAGQGPTSRLAGSVKNLVGAYLGYRAITGIYSAITTGARDAEQAQFNLEASVNAASREFENTGGLDQWQTKIKTLSADLKIYSESDIANAAARTVDMTKRLGLSADQMEVLISRTADLSAGKTTLEGGIERVTAALRGEAEASEFLGLTLNEDYIKSWYAANDVTEKAWKHLTDVEKAQIRYNVLLEQSAALQGRAADSTRTFNGALAEVEAKIKNAIANNEDLGDALADVAKLLSDNADEITDVAAAFAGGVGDLVKFVLENKELIGVLIGSGGLIALLSKTAGAITNINSAMKLMSASKTPELLGSGGSINAALLARIGLYGALAAAIVVTVSSYSSMRDAQDEAAAAQERASLSAANAQGIADAAAASTGLQIDTIRELNQLLRDGKVVRDEVTGQYLTAEQAEAKYTTGVARLIELNAQRNESFAGIEQMAADLTDQYGDLSAEALNASYKQGILDDALKSSKTSVEQAQKSSAKLADSYYDAASALAYLAEGEAGYEEALAAKLKAETAYVAAVDKLRDQQQAAFELSLDNEEITLENSLDTRLIALERELQDEWITKREYDERKAKAEQEHAETILAIRQRMYDEAAKQYGKDSQQAIEAHQDVIEAENDLASATNTADAAFENLYLDIKKCGEAGETAGKKGRAGMDTYRQGVEMTRKELRALRDEQERVAKEAERAKKQESRDAMAGGFYGQWDNITNHVNSFDSAEALQKWGQENRDQMFGSGRASGNQFTNALNKHARDAYLAKLAELDMTARETAKNTNLANIAAAQTSNTGTQKQMTINLKSGSSTTAVSIPEADAGKFLDVLQQAGMVTA